MPQIYLDYNASTPLARPVMDAMLPFIAEHYGNPSSGHWAGGPAREALDAARNEVALLLGATPDEIIFTSGGTEANNHAIKGVFFKARSANPHIITSAVEHPAVLEPCRFLERLGARITRLRVDPACRVDPDDVRRAIEPGTLLISIMHANNEVGTLEPISEISEIARQHGILFHTDAAQSVGKVPTEIARLGVDLLSVAGHKVYAPKGIGALYVRGGVELERFMHGAGHEKGRRAGTENVPFIVALGAACRLARLQPCSEQLAHLRDRFWAMLEDRFGKRVVLNGRDADRLPNTLNVSFIGQIGSEILGRLEGVAASTGSACHAGSHAMSPVLAAMGTAEPVGLGAIRFSLGRNSTQKDIDTVVSMLANAVR